MHSFWLTPGLCILVGILLGILARWMDEIVHISFFNFSPEGARNLLTSLSGSLLTFLVFVVSSMLLIVQIASGQLTPRIIAMAFSGRVAQRTLGFFVFNYTLCLSILARINDIVPQLSVGLAVISTLISIVVLFWFAQRLGGSLRPVSILQSVGEATREVLGQVYPEKFIADVSKRRNWRDDIKGLDSHIVTHQSNSGVLLAIDTRRLMEAAGRARCIIELIPQVGDFLPKDEPLFRVYPASASIAEYELQQSVIIGSERTLELDPMFGFRIMVDIASRALSPAINDPTTAVMVIDQLHRLLRYVGERRLSDGTIHDAGSNLRVVFPTPNWDDFTSMACTEIRMFGVGSIQIPRRLRAMLEHLLEVLPEQRKTALLVELRLLQEATQAGYSSGLNRQRAETPDRQGMGGSPVIKDGLQGDTKLVVNIAP
ncbi:MAG TPA: DUF2254 domain-containing protein [Gemmatales bacterium]|nr:DUF2254 domain-containing protein [Gemmatales bacterium]